MLKFHSKSLKFAIILSSRIITTLISILFVPLYVKIIGAESYGLVAFYGTLAGSLAILDMGLSTAISRQVLVLSTKPNSQKETSDLVFSVELIYWVVAILAGIIIILLAMPIAKYWVNAQTLSINTISTAIMLMGGIFVFNFPLSIYIGVLNSLNRQLPNAYINVIAAILKALGVIIALKYISASIECFFIWQICISLLVTLTMRYYTWDILKSGAKKSKATFSIIQLKTIGKFAAGMSGISLITFFLMQIDKIIVSKYVTLDYVGYYSLAFTVTGAITLCIEPLNPILFPQFTLLAAQNKESELITLFHKSCRLITIIVLPIGITLIFFANQILFLWTQNSILTQNTAPILQVCAAGTICNCLCWIPYWYLLSKGITKYTIYQNIISGLILVPMLFFWVGKYGALGASFVWLTVNLGCLLISVPIFHRLYLKGELKNWFLKDTLYPILLVLIIAGSFKYIQVLYFHNIEIIALGILLLIALLIYSIFLPETRLILIEKYKSLKIK